MPYFHVYQQKEWLKLISIYIYIYICINSCATKNPWNVTIPCRKPVLSWPTNCAWPSWPPTTELGGGLIFAHEVAYMGDGKPPTWKIGNPYFTGKKKTHLNTYKVDEFIPLYGNNGSLDPRTYNLVASNNSTVANFDCIIKNQSCSLVCGHNQNSKWTPMSSSSCERCQIQIMIFNQRSGTIRALFKPSAHLLSCT